jgi:hypothetical protein
MKNKYCSKCQLEKSIDEFGRDKSRKDGKYIYCKSCVAEYNKPLRKKHNDKRTAYNKKYRNENREKYNKWERNYYDQNSERLSINAKNWRETYSGTFRMLHIISKARAKKKNLEYELDDTILQTLSTLQNDCCALTNIPFDLKSNGFRYRPFAPSIDRKDSGKGYTYDNIQIVCVIVNKAKNEYPIELFDEMCRARVRKLDGS